MTNLVLTSTKSLAVTYSFKADNGLGWALCTLNEGTGEVLITSDWGNWSHRWDVSNLGVPTLTEFVAKGDVDYLARKLCPKDRVRRFSSTNTIDAFKHLLCKRRLQDGRAGSRNPRRQLTKSGARSLWHELEYLEDYEDSKDLFVHRACELDELLKFVAEPYEHLEYELTGEFLALRDTVLPPLIKACQEAHIKACNGNDESWLPKGWNGLRSSSDLRLACGVMGMDAEELDGIYTLKWKASYMADTHAFTGRFDDAVAYVKGVYARTQWTRGVADKNGGK